MATQSCRKRQAGNVERLGMPRAAAGAAIPAVGMCRVSSAFNSIASQVVRRHREVATGQGSERNGRWGVGGKLHWLRRPCCHCSGCSFRLCRATYKSQIDFAPFYSIGTLPFATVRLAPVARGEFAHKRSFMCGIGGTLCCFVLRFNEVEMAQK